MGISNYRNHEKFDDAWLVNEYRMRQSANQNYSIRSFARDLGVSKTTLAELLTKKRRLTTRTAERIAESLGLPPQSKKQFIENTVNHPNAAKPSLSPTRQLQEDQFRVIADWYYFAILSLAELPHAKADKDWIAERLGIKYETVCDAIDRLVRMNLLEFNESKGFFKSLENWVESPDGISSVAIKVHHQQNLRLAERALYNEPLSKRSFQAMTIAVDRDKIEDANKLMMEFKSKMASLLSTSNNNDVYTFTLNLFPARDRCIDEH